MVGGILRFQLIPYQKVNSLVAPRTQPEDCDPGSDPPASGSREVLQTQTTRPRLTQSLCGHKDLFDQRTCDGAIATMVCFFSSGAIIKN